MKYNVIVQTAKSCKKPPIIWDKYLPVRSCLSTASVTDLHDNVPGVKLWELSFLFFKNGATNNSNYKNFTLKLVEKNNNYI